MSISSITSKGQVTLPAAIRKQLNLKAGDRIAFTLKDNRIIAEPVSNDVSSLFGMVRSDTAVSLHDMDKAIARGASGK